MLINYLNRVVRTNVRHSHKEKERECVLNERIEILEARIYDKRIIHHLFHTIYRQLKPFSVLHTHSTHTLTRSLSVGILSCKRNIVLAVVICSHPLNTLNVSIDDSCCVASNLQWERELAPIFWLLSLGVILKR